MSTLPDDDEEVMELERALDAQARARDAQIDALQAAHASKPRVEVMDLETMLERYAYLLHEGKIVDLKQPWLTYTRKIFQDITASSTRTMIGPRGGERTVPLADDWLQHPARIDLQAVTFRPNADRLTRDLAGRHAVNMWSPPAILATPRPEDWQARAEVFRQHMDYLIPNAEERHNVVRWLAQRIQYPEILPGWHVLLIADNVQGTGRNWLARMMKRMLGPYVIEALPLQRILDGNFNGEIDQGLLGVVDEIREGGMEYWKHAEALKSFLSEKTRVINAKYRAPYEVGNYLAVMMFSNHIAALPLDKTDRRIYVADCTREPRDASYFDYIYAQLQDPLTLRSLYELLLTEPLADFAIEGRAPGSAVKREMIRGNTTTYEALLAEFAEDWPADVIRLARLEIELQRMLRHDRPSMDDLPKGLVPSGAARNNIYSRLNIKGDLRVTMDVKDVKEPDGKGTRAKTSVVVLRRWHEHWKEIVERGDLAELVTEAERGERDAPSR